MNKKYILLGFMLYLSITIQAQIDPHFTQYYMYPLHLNPGLTGLISDGDVRVTANTRSQWASVSNPYNTVGISGDMLLKNQWGLGVNILNQKAGNGGYNYSNVQVSVANGNIRFGTNGAQHISIGMQVGILTQRFDPYKLQFGDQYSAALGYNAGITSRAAVNTLTLSQNLFDIGAGIAYIDEQPDKKVNVYGGISFNHLNQPRNNFNSEVSRLPMRITAHAGARIIASPTLQFYPNFIYMQQGNAFEATPGIYAQMKVNDIMHVLLGGNYRLNDAVNAFTGIYYKNYSLGLSYDINTSNLNTIPKTVNSLEMSLSMTLLKNNKLETQFFKCPRF
jgi:type IX secretion system PorP/SprF family membrane protein